MVMAVGETSNGNTDNSKPCNCYTVANLTTQILESAHTSHLLERYDLGGQLGWGQFGVIRECNDIFTGEKFACKSIAKDRLVTEGDVRSLKLEIEIMSRLSGHPNVVELKAVYEEEHYVHLVMELCAGGELFHRLEKNGRFPEPNARILFQHLMKVVMYCHDNGIVHRDLKPENILLATNSSSSPIKLADFGLATFIKPGQNLHGTVGSPFYIAPEVLGGGYSQAADVWSAGVILYILLSGMPPFWGKTKSRIFDAVRAAKLWFPSDSWDHVSSSAKDLITGMLCKDPAQRLTAAQVLAHPWIRGSTQQLQGSDKLYNLFNYGHREMGACSFSTPFVSGFRDLSFSSESPIVGDATANYSSPTFTCKSSFSSFVVNDIPSALNGGFSFHSSGESSSVGFSSPVQSMPSFAFFDPSSNVQDNLLAIEADISDGSKIQRGEVFFGCYLVNLQLERCKFHCLFSCRLQLWETIFIAGFFCLLRP
uniref:non-specific serine/threonine protein kinase n=1 Tax=Anthurium amnicola TaxID=1678845 RepID=A0A1D1YQ28_9ARAE